MHKQQPKCYTVFKVPLNITTVLIQCLASSTAKSRIRESNSYPREDFGNERLKLLVAKADPEDLEAAEKTRLEKKR